MNTQSKTHAQMMSFSKLLHETFSLLSERFLEFLFAVALPLIVFLTFFWSTVGLFIVNLNQISNYEDLVKVFSLQNGSSLFALLAFTLIAFVNILGFIAAPLVAIQHETITVRTIFPKAMRYFGSAVLMLIMLGVIYLLLLIIGYVIVTVILTILALFNLDILESAQVVLSNIIPPLLILLGTYFFTFSPYVLVDKNQGAWHAISTSVELVKKHFWPLLVRIVLLIIALSLVTFIIQFIPIVGYAMSVCINVIVVTVYTYILYREVQ